MTILINPPRWITTTYRADGSVAAVDLTPEDTVTFHLPEPPDEFTQRIVPPPRRPRLDDTVEQPTYRVPRTIGIVDEPTATDALPPFAQYASRRSEPSYADRVLHTARHGAHRPGLVERLFARLFGRRGRRD